MSLGDVQVVGGFGMLIYGVSMLSPAWAWIVAGMLLLAGWLAPRFPRAKKGS